MFAICAMEAGPSRTHVWTSRSTSLWPDIALIVPNEGSIARDLLANERNYLTWLRLSCSLIILGFTVLLKFRLPAENDDSHGGWDEDSRITAPIGYTFVAIGLLSFIVGISKYFKNQRLLTKHRNFIQAGWGSFITAGIVFFVGCTVMILASIHSTLFQNPR